MFTMKNGLLHKDGKPVYGLGLSYYASYHERKVPVPPEADRMGEMKKDLKGMTDAGFNVVRFAALGDLSYDENKNVVYKSELMDEMAKEADKIGIATMIRLQGYASNLSGHENVLMIDSQGKPMDTTRWYDFIQNSFFHEGILTDNNAVTKALARHFKDICNVVCFQTYNEPHYPSMGIFDYHPDTIKAYRKWLVSENIMTESEAANYNPPKKRPEKGEDAKPWINWRLFSIKAMSDFLGNCSDIAYEETGIETMTCLTTDPIAQINAGRCVNFYDSAERMNAMGITHYISEKAPEVYLASLDLDMAESAGSIYGKPMWLVEYDARTDIPQEKFRKETYLALGSSCKGIMYYQWRGDFRYPDSPEGNGFGIINDDGTPTSNFENAKNVVSLINKLSDYFVNADKLRSGVAILHSDYAYMHSDAIDNTGDEMDSAKLKNSWFDELTRLYKALRVENISPDIIRAKDLEKNPLDTKVLYTPTMELLSEEEVGYIKNFAAKGGKVIVKNEKHRHCIGYIPIDYVQEKYNCEYEIYETLELCGVSAPVVMTGERGLLHQTLKGDGYYIICITNAKNIEKTAENTVIKTEFDFTEATLYTFENQAGESLKVTDNSFAIEKIEDGAIIILK